MSYDNGKIYRIRCLKTGRFYIGSTIKTLDARSYGHVEHFNFYKKGYGSYISSFKIIEYGNWVIELVENFPCENERDLQLREGYWQRRFQDDKKLVNMKFIGQTKNEGKRRRRQKQRRENNFFMDVCLFNEMNRLFQTEEDRVQKQLDHHQQKRQYYLDTYEPEYHTVLNNLFKTADGLAEEEAIRKEKKRQSDNEYRQRNLEKIKAKDNEYRQNEEVKERARERAKQWAQENKERQKAWQKEKIECECGSVVTRSGLSLHRKMKKHIEFIEKKI